MVAEREAAFASIEQIGMENTVMNIEKNSGDVKWLPRALALLSRYTLDQNGDSMPTQILNRKGEFVQLQKHLLSQVR